MIFRCDKKKEGYTIMKDIKHQPQLPVKSNHLISVYNYDFGVMVGQA